MRFPVAVLYFGAFGPVIALRSPWASPKGNFHSISDFVDSRLGRFLWSTTRRFHARTHDYDDFIWNISRLWRESSSSFPIYGTRTTRRPSDIHVGSPIFNWQREELKEQEKDERARQFELEREKIELEKQKMSLELEKLKLSTSNNSTEVSNPNTGPVCLPLAQVKISLKSREVRTKAAVVRSELDKGRYIMGNRTASLLTDAQLKEISTPYATNAIQTRAQALRTQNNESKQREIHSKEDTSLSPNDDKEDISLQTEIQESVPELTLEDEDFQLPSLDANGDELSLLKISVDELLKSQAEDSELKPLFELAKVSHENDKKNQNFVVNELLIKKHEDHVGDVRKLIVIPKKFRARIMSLCHENTSGHLGVTKTKDRLARHFFWPKCYKDVENYVRSCDSCQKAGKPNEKKAPLKLVPIIQEVFSKLNIDAVGPLPTNQNGKRFIITSICLSSKYPDAVPVTDLTSISVTDALLNIFSRTGFPAEIQCDQGTSFVSNLTSEFFERFGIKVCHSSVHHPQSNPVERFHRTIKRILRVGYDDCNI
ncbi:unnamed protein product [Larinioides sclopetarius]|uniref:RNA-directed DNA polymerase n=1 Tax=Larinioides sclopetarius TaxID=280406 RepID=A0AAV2BBQ3_9ARAC